MYLQSRNRDTDVDNKHMDTKGRRGDGMDCEAGIDIYTLLCIKQIINENQLYSTREFCSVLCGDLRKYGGKGICVCVYITDSLCCKAETNTTL